MVFILHVFLLMLLLLLLAAIDSGKMSNPAICYGLFKNCHLFFTFMELAMNSIALFSSFFHSFMLVSKCLSNFFHVFECLIRFL